MMSAAGLLGATAELAVVLKLKDEISGPLGRAGQSVDSFNRKQSGLAGAGARISSGLGTATRAIEGMAVAGAVGLAGLGLAAVHQATTFQQQMELVKTEAGGTQQEVDTMSQAILQMAGQVGTGPDELAMGLYHVESAGLRGAKALDVLHAAAIGAKVGGADLESVTNALVAAQMSGIGGVTSMTQAMADLDAIVGSGNMRMQDLADSMGTGILGTAKTFGVTLQDVGSALATLTDAGVPAVDAATRLSHTFVMMGAPTAAAQKALKSIGIGQFDLAKAMRQPDGVFAALQVLHDHLAKVGDISANGTLSPQGAAILSKAFGGGRFSATIMQLLGQMDRVKTKYDGIIAQEGEFGDKTVATQQTAAYQWGQLQANISALAITFGEALLPGVNDVVKGLNQIVSQNGPQIASFAHDVGGAFTDFVAKLRDVDWGALAGAFESVAGKVGDIVSAFLHAPQWVQELLIGGFVANKLTGGFVIHAALDVGESLLKGVAGGLGGALAQAGIGKAFIQPVFVTNMGPGFGPGGGPGGPAGPAGPLNTAEDAAGGLTITGILKFGLRALGFGAGLGLMSVNNAAGPNGGLNGSGFFGNIAGGALAGASVAGPFGALAGGLIGITKGVQEQVSSHNAAMATGISDTIQQLIASHATPDQLQKALDATNQGIDRLNNFAGPLSGIANAVVGGGALDQLKADRDALLKAVSATRPAAVGEHSALGPKLIASINHMENLNTANAIAHRAGEHADIASVVAAQRLAVSTAERKGNEVDSGLDSLRSRLSSSIALVGDAIRHVPPPQVHVAGTTVNVNVSTTVTPYAYTRTNTRVNRYGPPVAV